MDKFINGLKNETNFGYTENGAITHLSTLDSLYDMFALGGAYRERSDEDCIVLFKSALEQNETLALKCLFYLRDVRGGQGERRFFRVCLNWLAKTHPDMVLRNLEFISEFGRWDDLYCLVGTSVEPAAFNLIKEQAALDILCETPSLLGKWLKSENASSAETKRLGTITRKYFGMTSKQYRKMLSVLRSRINIVEKLMSENRWEEIQFDKLPSKAGFIYRNAFARRDIIKERYKKFAMDETTKVNAKTLYPYECVREALNMRWGTTERAMINKYWDNLADYINGAVFNGMAVVDVSGSMFGTPMEVAISLGMYCAEKATGPYHNHFITFSANPQLVEIRGVDFVEKVQRMERADWGMNTDLYAAFRLLLTTAIKNHCSQEEIPQNLIVISDMEFDRCVCSYGARDKETLMESIRREWADKGYQMPKLIFWNVNARHDNIPMRDEAGITFVSGFSPVLYEQIMQGKNGYSLMMDKLNSDRYSVIQ